MGNETIFRSMLELSAVIPAAILCYLPMKGHLNKKGRRMTLWGIPVLLLWVVVGGAVCYRFRWNTNLWMVPSLVLFALCYCRAIPLSYWKSVSVFLAVCGVFSSMKNLAIVMDALLSPKSGSVDFFSERGDGLCPAVLGAAGACVVSGHPRCKMASG